MVRTNCGALVQGSCVSTSSLPIAGIFAVLLLVMVGLGFLLPLKTGLESFLVFVDSLDNVFQPEITGTLDNRKDPGRLGMVVPVLFITYIFDVITHRTVDNFRDVQR